MKDSKKLANIIWYILAILSLILSILGTISSNSFLIITGAFFLLALIQEK